MNLWLMKGGYASDTMYETIADYHLECVYEL